MPVDSNFGSDQCPENRKKSKICGGGIEFWYRDNVKYVTFKNF